MSDTKLISLRVPNDLLDWADRIAQVENRSRAQVVVMALQSYCPTRMRKNAVVVTTPIPTVEEFKRAVEYVVKEAE